MPKVLRIATRKSALALWQANYVKQELELVHSELEISLVPMTSRGDQILDVPLAKVGGKGLFVKELEHALLENTADIAVHSMKDVPMEFPSGLELAVICEREDPRDAFVSEHFNTLQELPTGSRVGTSSLRRQCQLLALRPDLKIEFLRGNVNTRLSKLENGDFDAIILAAAGLIRLGFEDRIREKIVVETSLPAGGQGAVGIECRSDDNETKKILSVLGHKKTTETVTAERALVRRLQGGCQVPIGAYAIHDQDQQLWLRALVGDPSGAPIIKKEIKGLAKDADQLGTALAEQLIAAGADKILAAFAH